MGRTLVTGSDEAEDFDAICDLCNSDDQRVEATGHCIDCNENMCISCIIFHRKLPAVKNHVIKDKSTLSQSQKARSMVNRSALDTDPMADRCPEHPDELIKFYCNSHCKLSCSDCISLDHRSCIDISYIKDISGDIASTDELNKTQTDLQMLIARLKCTETRTKWIKQTLNDSYSQAISDIRKRKKEIFKKLNQLENKLLSKLSLMKREPSNTLDGVLSACKNLIAQTEEIMADIDKKKAMNHNNQLFISMKQAQRQISHLDDEAEQSTCSESNFEHLSFKPDEHLNNLLSTLTNLGEIILVSQNEDVRAKYQHDIYVKSDTDTHDCKINGIIVLPDGRLVLSDYSNRCVKLVTECEVSDQITLNAKPLDLTQTTDDTIAVTLEYQRYIQVLSVSPDLSKSHTIAVPYLYYGIEHTTDRLILVCRDPTSAVHICDMTGVVLQEIDTDYSGNKLFTMASRIAISPDHGVMYVSDCHENTVVCLTMDGRLICKYVADNLDTPVGIAVDDCGYPYVCSSESWAIHQMCPSGKLVKVLLKKNRKNKTLYPVSIVVNTGHVYIGIIAL